MGDKTGIQWTDSTWNPVTGCTEVSPGCDHCYAKTLAERFRGTPGHYFERGFDVQLREDKLVLPLKWRKPRHIFVNSMSDLFHDGVPDEYIARVFEVMALAPHHTFQVLTKRHARMRSLVSRGLLDMIDDPDGDVRVKVPRWPLPNVWLGVSAEDQHWADIRIPALLDTPAAVRFVSAEPLLGPIDLRQAFRKWTPPEGHPEWQEHNLGAELKANQVLHWLIVGGESGPKDRATQVDWVRSLRDQCQAGGIPFFFKQWGETVPLGQMTDEARRRWDDEHGADCYPEESLWRVGRKIAGRELDGRTWEEFPR